MPLFQKNPLSMRGRLEKCWLFTFRTPAEAVSGLLPPTLELITRGGFAFWNVVVCEISHLRPRGFPACTGLRYRHVGYRLHVRHRNNGASLEGLYFVRSDCDSRLVTAAGNRLTDFGFHPARIRIEESDTRTEITLDSPDLPAHAVLDHTVPVALAPDSPFDSIYQAKAVLKYKPFGLSPAPGGKTNIVAIGRDEAAWRSKLVHVREQDWAFFAGQPVTPEICYEVDPIDYQWNRGRIVGGSGRKCRAEAPSAPGESLRTPIASCQTLDEGEMPVGCEEREVVSDGNGTDPQGVGGNGSPRAAKV